MKYALVDEETATVVNVIEWDGIREKWAPPPGLRAVELADGADIGDIHDGDTFTRPAPAQQQRRKDRLDRVLDALVARSVLTRQQADDL